MKMVKSLILGTAAGLVAMTGAQAADLPVKAKPVQYVKICSLYGAGFYYIPGTDTCIKVGGFVRAEVNFNAGGSFSVLSSGDLNSSLQGKAQYWRTRAGITVDTRSQTEYGTLRSYFVIAPTTNNSGSGDGSGAGNTGGTGSNPYVPIWSNAAFIQLAGFTLGKTASFFDFDGMGYSNQTNFWGSSLGGGGIQVFAYTAQLGNGLSASLSIEDPHSRRTAIVSGNSTTTGWQYANGNIPDMVGNLRVDQAWGSAQIMGAYHELNAASSGTVTTASDARSSGFSVGGGVKFNLPMLGKGDNVIAQVAYAKGAMGYIASGGGTGFGLTSDGGNMRHVGQLYDAVYTGGAFEKTTGWSVTGGYEHHWNPAWKTSLYGAYGKVEYSSVASAAILATGADAGSSANWSYTQVGSRTVWTPVANLDLSVDVMYNNLNTAYTGATYADKSWWSGVFRAQRNFWP